MTQAVAHLLEAAAQLSAPERTDLADHLVETLAQEQEIAPSIEQAQFAEVRRRITQAEAGTATLIPGEEALARVRQRLSSVHAAS